MVNRGSELSFFHVRIDIRIDMSIYLRPMTTKFGKHLDIEELTQMRLITQVLVTSSSQYHMRN